MDQNLKIQLGNINQKVEIMKGMGLSSDEIEKSFSKAELDIIQKAMPHKYIRKEGEKYIYDEPKAHEKKEGPEAKVIGESCSVQKLMEPVWGKTKGFLYFTDGMRADYPTIQERVEKNKTGIVSLLDITGNSGENEVDPKTFKNDKIDSSYSVKINSKKGNYQLLQHRIDSEQPEKKEKKQFKIKNLNEAKNKFDLNKRLLIHAKEEIKDATKALSEGMGTKIAERSRIKEAEKTIEEMDSFFKEARERFGLDDNPESPTIQKSNNDVDESGLEKAEDESKEKKVARVMKEFKDGKLKSSSGEVVTDHSQAIAIAMSEAGLSKKD